ncbi:MAG: A/G-specific adenine glycosylase [Woeseiaceae bacterium]
MPIAPRVLDWFDEHGRKDLPWQHGKTRYRVWVSEIMLQQTQVASVIDYFQRFMSRFPDVQTLASASADDVLSHWSGLGYYARARNLHKSAQIVVENHAGEFPGTQAGLEALPGIGRSTAAAILALVDGQRCAILDGNVKRVLARHDVIAGWPGKTDVLKTLWAAAEQYTPDERVADYTQAMMDLGATLCKRSRPDCDRCPLIETCRAYENGTVNEYPGKRAKKATPKRQTRFLVLRRDDGALWFERRPEKGIWGGLYCFPQYEAEPPIPAGFETKEPTALTPIAHKFTHFDLAIEPVLFEVRHTGVADSDDGRWINIDALDQVGVPKPVEQIVESLQSGNFQKGLLL